MKPVYLALGSNLGDREEHLRSAIRGLAKRGMDIIRCASVYSTEPREVLDQPWFLNTVLEVRTDLTPDELLRTCLEVEKENHRTRDTNKGPRTLDIDILFYGNEVIRKPGLSIPHPAFSGRRFVLAPLAEIAPDFVDPTSGKTVGQLLEACTDAATVTRVSDAPVSFRPSPSAQQ
jgi:2-amino-4-hydroxy-6-hydroxymethyldihydropteridine diphosphokinase